MKIDEIDDILRQNASKESVSWKTSDLLDEKILNSARTHKKIIFNKKQTSPFRRFWIPLLVGVPLCICLAFLIIPRQPSSSVMEKDCLQFYAQLTKAINNKNIEQIAQAYDNRSAGMEKEEMRSRLKSLFTKYDSITYKPSDILIKTDGSHAVIMSAFELTAVSHDGPVNITGTEKIYFERTGHDIKVALWVSQ